MLPADIHDLARKVIESYAEQKRRIVTAESCTGGLIAGALTDIPGASDVLERGFVSYSNAAKIEVLGVMPDVLESYGAVSAQIAEAMAKGALEFSHADVAVSVTGIAGPGGGSAEKPVGLVHLALARRGEKVHSEQQVFPGDRSAIRRATVERALALLFAAAER